MAVFAGPGNLSSISMRTSVMNERSPGQNRPLIDHSAALEHLDGDRELLLEIHAVFQQEAPRQMRQLRDALTQPDPKPAARHAHTLKGMAAQIGASLLEEACRNLERNLSEGTDLPAAFDLDRLAHLLARVLDELAAREGDS
jgi:HPt (histidine-containing phosphotransfer) domain-containing protein